MSTDLGGEGAAVKHGLVGKLLHERQMWQMVQPAKRPYRSCNVRRPAATITMGGHQKSLKPVGINSRSLIVQTTAR